MVQRPFEPAERGLQAGTFISRTGKLVDLVGSPAESPFKTDGLCHGSLEALIKLGSDGCNAENFLIFFISLIHLCGPWQPGLKWRFEWGLELMQSHEQPWHVHITALRNFLNSLPCATPAWRR